MNAFDPFVGKRPVLTALQPRTHRAQVFGQGRGAQGDAGGATSGSAAHLNTQAAFAWPLALTVYSGDACRQRSAAKALRALPERHEEKIEIAHCFTLSDLGSYIGFRDAVALTRVPAISIS